MKTKLKLLFYYWLPVIVWMGVIYWLSSFHKLSVSDVTWQDFVTRKLAHLTEYAILSGLIYRALGSVNTPLTTNHRSLVTILMAVLYALTDEYHQTLVSGRTGRWFDVGIDSAGVIIGTVLTYYRLPKKIVSVLTSFWGAKATPESKDSRILDKPE